MAPLLIALPSFGIGAIGGTRPILKDYLQAFFD